MSPIFLLPRHFLQDRSRKQITLSFLPQIQPPTIIVPRDVHYLESTANTLTDNDKCFHIHWKIITRIVRLLGLYLLIVGSFQIVWLLVYILWHRRRNDGP
jgi:hypothetical protein